MKATITFDLLKEQADFEACSKGIDLAIFQMDLEEWIRNKLKYTALKPNQGEIIEELKQWVNENKVQLDYME